MAWDEPNQNWDLAQFLGGIGAMFQIVEDYSRDGVDTTGKDAPGWSQMMDILRTPNEALGWLAQFVGVTLEVGLSDADQRARIQSTDGWRRGTVSALRGAAASTLTGTKTFAFRERYNPSVPGVDYPYHLEIVTYTAETPDPVATLSAITAQKPAGIILHYVTLSGQDYQSVRTNNVSYLALRSKYATYSDMRMDLGT